MARKPSARRPPGSKGQPGPSDPAPTAASARTWWIAAGLALLTIAVYAAVAHFEFVTWDDGNYIHIDPVRNGLTARGVAWAFTTGETANWHPLTWLSHMLDVAMYGDEAGGHHVTNLILHVANVLLLYGVFVRMTGAAGRSAFVAALFAVHPLHVESVAWVAERKDVLSTFFALVTIWTYVTYVRRPRTSRFLIVCVWYALGLMAKPMLVTLPFVLLLLDVWPLGRARPGGGTAWRALVVEKVPLLALAAAASVTTVLLQRQAGAMGDGASDAFPIGLRIGNAIVSYAAYLGQTAWPAGLSPFYPYPRAVSAVAVVVSLAVLAGLSFAAMRAARRRPYVLVGWLWFVGMLVPVIGLIQVGQQSRADRYTYLPLVGIFIIVAWSTSGSDRTSVRATAELVKRSSDRTSVRATTIAACAVVLAYAVTAWFQVETWTNSFTLWSHALEVTTANDRAYNGLGAELGNRGKIDEAIGKFQEALRINPSFADAHVNLAVAFAVQGKLNEAIPHYAEALRLQPGHRDARNNYAVALEGVGRLDDAVQQYRISLQSDPNQSGVHLNLGLALARQGKVAEAIRELNETLRLEPGNETAKQALAQLKGGKS